MSCQQYASSDRQCAKNASVTATYELNTVNCQFIAQGFYAGIVVTTSAQFRKFSCLLGSVILRIYV